MAKMKFAKPDESRVISITLMTDIKSEAMVRYSATLKEGCVSTFHSGKEATQYGAKYMVCSSGPICKLKQAIQMPDEYWYEMIHG